MDCAACSGLQGAAEPLQQQVLSNSRSPLLDCSRAGQHAQCADQNSVGRAVTLPTPSTSMTAPPQRGTTRRTQAQRFPKARPSIISFSRPLSSPAALHILAGVVQLFKNGPQRMDACHSIFHVFKRQKLDRWRQQEKGAIK